MKDRILYFDFLFYKSFYDLYYQRYKRCNFLLEIIKK